MEGRKGLCRVPPSFLHTSCLECACLEQHTSLHASGLSLDGYTKALLRLVLFTIEMNQSDASSRKPWSHLGACHNASGTTRFSDHIVTSRNTISLFL